MNELLELITALWTQDDVTYEGRFYRVRDLHARPEARPAAAPADLDRRRHAAVREDLRPAACPPVEPVLRRIAKYAKTWVPHSSATAEMVDRDWDDLRALHGRVRAAARTRCRACTRTSCTCSGPASGPRTRRRCSASTRAWTSTTGSEYYLLGEAEEVAERIRGQDRGARRRRPPHAQPAQLGPGEPRAARDATSCRGWRPDRGGRRHQPAPALPPPATGSTTRSRSSRVEPRLVVRRRHRRLPGARHPADRPARARHHGARRRCAASARRRATPGGSRRLTTWTDVAEADAAARARRAARGGPRRSAGGRSRTRARCAATSSTPRRRPTGCPTCWRWTPLVEIASADGARVVPIADFVLGQPPDGPARPGELVTGLRCRRSRGAVRRRRPVHVPQAGVARLPRDLDRRGGGGRSSSTAGSSSTRGSRSGPARRSRGGCAASSASSAGRRAGPALATVPAMEHLSPLAPDRRRPRVRATTAGTRR